MGWSISPNLLWDIFWTLTESITWICQCSWERCSHKSYLKKCIKIMIFLFQRIPNSLHDNWYNMLLTKKKNTLFQHATPTKGNHLLSWLVKHSQWSQQQHIHSNRWATILTTPIQEMVCIYNLCLQLPWHIWWQQVHVKCCWINLIMHCNKWKRDYFPPVNYCRKNHTIKPPPHAVVIFTFLSPKDACKCY